MSRELGPVLSAGRVWPFVVAVAPSVLAPSWIVVVPLVVGGAPLTWVVPLILVVVEVPLLGKGAIGEVAVHLMVSQGLSRPLEVGVFETSPAQGK